MPATGWNQRFPIAFNAIRNTPGLGVVNDLYQFCTSYGGMVWLALASDLSIALAYFAIPVTMGVVLSQRKDDIPYPWLWTLFVVFIVACGMTHVVHVWSYLTGNDYLGTQVVIGLITAAASVGTAVAFAFILPQIRNLPSPRQQRALLERTVAARTAEKDKLIHEINHRVGNQLQVMSSLLRIEMRRVQNSDGAEALQRIDAEIQKLIDRHLASSTVDHLGQPAERETASMTTSARREGETA